MPRLSITASCLALALAVASYAATGNVVAAGYQLPTTITAAPGQLLTILVQGITAPQQRLSAGTGQWPSTLAGVTATLTAQTSTGIRTLAVPIGSVYPFSNCAPGAGPSCGTLVGLTIQVPFEMLGPLPSQKLTPPVAAAVLTVSDQDGHSATISVGPISDQIHVVRSLDSIAGGQGGGNPAVTHADGSPVSVSSPAEPGETLVMYAVGLGDTNPSPASGAPSPASPLAKTQQQFGLNYDFEANVSPSPGVQGNSAVGSVPTPGPVFVGLTPGLVGLYQINFYVSSPPAGTLSCGGPVASNLTVTLVGAASFDGAGICVDLSGR
jgi:hypothetical protein